MDDVDEWADRVVAEAPPLSAGQRARLAVLLDDGDADQAEGDAA